MRAPARLRTALSTLVVPLVGVAVCLASVSLGAVPVEAASPRDRADLRSSPPTASPGTAAGLSPTGAAAFSWGSWTSPVPTSLGLKRAVASGADRWTGYAFDACRAPSSRVMDRWRVASPFLGAGIYIGGELRACPQKHLTRGWVEHQTRQGWRLLPIWVGPQASCTSYRRTISSRPGAQGRYPTARAQGAAAARGARAAAQRLGLGRGTTLWYDLEWFPTGNHRCRTSALHFLSAWTRELHRTGHQSGVYSSVSAGIAVLGRERGSSRYTAPDRVWFAWANGRRDVSWGKYVKAPRWKTDGRVHQYALDVRATYGGVRMAIDRNFVDLGSSPELRREPAVCGPAADRTNYGLLRRGSRGHRVGLAQCLLHAAGHYRGGPGRSYDDRTHRAMRSFQRTHDLRATGRTDDRTWAALLAAGSRPLLKHGSEGPDVRRLQRALTAALPGAVRVHGHFGPATTSAVRRYQARTGLRVSGVATPATWRALRTGAADVRRHAGKHHGKAHDKHKAGHGKPGKAHKKDHAEKSPGRKHGKKPGKKHR